MSTESHRPFTWQQMSARNPAHQRHSVPKLNTTFTVSGQHDEFQFHSMSTFRYSFTKQKRESKWKFLKTLRNSVTETYFICFDENSQIQSIFSQTFGFCTVRKHNYAADRTLSSQH